MRYNLLMDKEKRNARAKRYWDTKDHLSFNMEKGTKEQIAQAAARLGISQGEFMRQAITEKLERLK